MRRTIWSLVIVFVVAACGGADGASDGDNGPDQGSSPANTQAEPSSDGTKLLVPSPVGGIDVVDLDAETQEPLVTGIGQAQSLQLVGDTIWFVEGNDVVTADARSGEVTGRATMPDVIADITVAGDTAWVLTGYVGAATGITGVDVGDMSILGTVTAPEGTSYWEVVADDDVLWAFGGDPEYLTSMSRIDTTTFEQVETVDTGILAESVVMGDGAIWVGGTIPAYLSDSGNPESGVAEVDPQTGEVRRTISFGEPDDIVELRLAFGKLWATQGLAALLHQVDTSTGEVLTTVDTGDGAAGIPMEILTTSDLVWVYNPTDGTIQAYDPDSVEFVNGINAPRGAPKPIFAP